MRPPGACAAHASSQAASCASSALARAIASLSAPSVRRRASCSSVCSTSALASAAAWASACTRSIRASAELREHRLRALPWQSFAAPRNDDESSSRSKIFSWWACFRSSDRSRPRPSLTVAGGTWWGQRASSVSRLHDLSIRFVYKGREFVSASLLGSRRQTRRVVECVCVTKLPKMDTAALIKLRMPARRSSSPSASRALCAGDARVHRQHTESSTTNLVANDEALAVKASGLATRFTLAWKGKIWAVIRLRVCGLEWDGSKTAKTNATQSLTAVETPTKCTWNLQGVNRSLQCGQVWPRVGQLDSGGQRNAKWDCGGSADPVTIENGYIYAIDSDGTKCGLA